MQHTLLTFQRRIYLLQVLFAALAIVLLLQVGTRFDHTVGSVQSTYGPLQLHSGPSAKTERVRKHPSAKKAVKKAAKPSRRGFGASSSR